jgi:hypothetical protein
MGAGRALAECTGRLNAANPRGPRLGEGLRCGKKVISVRGAYSGLLGLGRHRPYGFLAFGVKRHPISVEPLC